MPPRPVRLALGLMLLAVSAVFDDANQRFADYSAGAYFALYAALGLCTSPPRALQTELPIEPAIRASHANVNSSTTPRVG